MGKDKTMRGNQRRQGNNSGRSNSGDRNYGNSSNYGYGNSNKPPSLLDMSSGYGNKGRNNNNSMSSVFDVPSGSGYGSGSRSVKSPEQIAFGECIYVIWMFQE